MEGAFQTHPVPQNVTNFEFHLIGDMTLKQFGYLAAGLGFAYLVFVLLAGTFPFIAWPVILLSSLTGIAFAFLPIQERPLDHWVAAFFSAIFKPTKMEYKSAVLTKEDPLFKNRLNIYLKSFKSVSSYAFGNSGFINPILNEKIAVSMPASTSTQDGATTPLPLPSLRSVSSESIGVNDTPLPPVSEGNALKKTVELARDAQDTQSKIKEIEVSLEEIKKKAASAGEDPREYIEKFEGLLNELQKLNIEAGSLAKQMAQITQTATRPASAPAVKARNIPTLTLTTFDNVINGIVTDWEGNYLENAIIVAHDKQGLPVRALKSNKLGQFIAATPLPNGIYTIVVEKEGMMFDVVEVELKGDVLKPVMISAKRSVALS
ncbi:MAG: hypothetical protein ACD_30C00075G0002 [uncultured bacterium]|uniref:Uncharacterized protein n=3 Tax=Candidatus Daviesiibacteriota TaxID=1752718 RepID=A0A0G0H8T7_9BACT|nr:MAG: hypothetical protein ACD_30C00075G0002 [uncultured bacterium]KKQ08509.1 MAG: hypothetical protein US19_C0023G0010 [Candidatus Daviesbacteria bacterium GW2011_GWB1_36_5]KKQ15973.1 MAG: hypothetical protein US28_C0007G0064 [Candidatus Daviesbacteria bacterium GW2011_GWA1_36_8]OGE33180.1 MAG: hypothetical protein A3C99_00370 [Candidatus Daviesbacteria bacterium RIFCSPHIGHO2_02_FULL_37_9]OGE34997.1 MAG: hypothetical protein A3E66_04225 [Candidatus Daviesbacteria bacterium RIFCSPHIGHO2_12_FU